MERSYGSWIYINTCSWHRRVVSSIPAHALLGNNSLVVCTSPLLLLSTSWKPGDANCWYYKIVWIFGHERIKYRKKRWNNHETLLKIITTESLKGGIILCHKYLWCSVDRFRFLLSIWYNWIIVESDVKHQML